MSAGGSVSISGAGRSGIASSASVAGGGVVAQSTCIMRSALVDARGYTVSIFPANGTMPTAARLNATMMG